MTHALNGFNKMPVRGGEPDLSDLEVARGVAYMTTAAGAHFFHQLGRDILAFVLGRHHLVSRANRLFIHQVACQAWSRAKIECGCFIAILRMGQSAQLWTFSMA